MSYAAGPDRREAILDAEQKRLDWLRANPAIPVLEWGQEMLYPAGDLGEVTAVAAIAVRDVEELETGYRVIVRFGAGVSYVAIVTEKTKTQVVAA